MVTDQYVAALTSIRREKDRTFTSHPSSPLTPSQRSRFEGLAYFPIDPAMRIVAPIDRSDSGGTIEMQTTDGGIQTYRRFGSVAFRVADQTARITLFDGGDGALFVPFRDATSGQESYGGGRYLDLEAPTDQTLVLDLNEAYNPYCAYNARWTCPIPPAENWLSVPIRAGERAFPGAAA